MAVNFNQDSVWNLKPIRVDAVKGEVNGLLIGGEEVVMAFQTVRDQLLFTNKRIIAVDVQGITGKRKSFSTMPYSKIQYFSIQTPGFGELILEPQSDIDRVRAWLLEHGFYLAQENFVEEDGKYYPILRAVHGEKEDLKAEELFYGPRLLENQNPVLLEYLQKQQNQNRMLIGQLSGNPGEKAAQRLCELKEKEAILESALARFHTM